MSTKKQKGFYGWTIVATAFAVIFLHLSIRGSFAVFVQPMTEALGWSTTDVSIGLSLFMFFYGVTAFAAGRMVDKYGPRWIILVHGLLLGLGIYLSSLVNAPWQFYLTYGVMGGVGAGALYVPPTAMVRKWFYKDLGKATGMAVAGAGLGFFVAPIASMYLIEYMSFDFAFKMFGIIIMVGVFVAAMFMRGTPEEIGQKPYGYDEVIKKENEEAAKNKTKPIVWSLLAAIKTPAFWTIVLMYFCSNFAEYIVFSHSVNYVVSDRGFALKTATWIYALIGICFLFFGPIGGSYADKIGARLNNEFLGRKRVLIGAYIIVAIASAWLTFVDRPWMYVVYVIVYGIPFGVYIPCVAAYVGTTFGRESMGAIWGLVTVFGVAAGAGVGPYVGGLLKDLTGNYQASIWLACGIYILAAILAALVKKPESEQSSL